MARIAGALREFFLIRYPVDFTRPHDPTASWEKPPPPDPELPAFQPGTPDGSFDHPVVDPSSTDVATAIPTLKKPVPRPHRFDHDRTIVLVAHDKRERPSDDD